MLAVSIDALKHAPDDLTISWTQVVQHMRDGA